MCCYTCHHAFYRHATSFHEMYLEPCYQDYHNNNNNDNDYDDDDDDDDDDDNNNSGKERVLNETE